MACRARGYFLSDFMACSNLPYLVPLTATALHSPDYTHPMDTIKLVNRGLGLSLYEENFIPHQKIFDAFIESCHHCCLRSTHFDSVAGYSCSYCRCEIKRLKFKYVFYFDDA